jgi:mRNA-degrading endonuclease RelE of RelBE toxin-antitoxin system
VEEYRVFLRPAALRELHAMDAATRAPIVDDVRNLSLDLRPPSSRRLWRRSSYRMVANGYQFFYMIDVNTLSVVIVTVQSTK